MPAPTRHGPAGRLNAEVVLVMEDEPIVRGVVRVMLEEAGCSVLAPTSVREGLKLLQDPTNLPDVLVTDCVMPGVRSGEFARRARTLRPDLPIVTMSGNLALRNPSSVAAIADAFLQKPFTRDELVAAVSLALEARVGAHRRLGAD
jgi:CheY-like chemotaxis protein